MVRLGFEDLEMKNEFSEENVEVVKDLLVESGRPDI